MDDKLPHDLVSKRTFRRVQLVSPEETKLNRFSLINGFPVKKQLLVSNEASEKAYAARVYIVAVDSRRRRQSSMLAAKIEKLLH